MTGHEYAILILNKYRYRTVTRADGSKVHITGNPDRLEEKLSSTRKEYEGEVQRKHHEAVVEWQRRFVTWKEHLRREESLTEGRLKRTKETSVALLDPDGATVLVVGPAAIPPDEVDIQAALQQHWEKHFERKPVKADSGLHVGEVLRGWTATLRTGDDSEFLVTLDNPHVGEFTFLAARLLNELAAANWRVIAVNEDKALYWGEDTNEESGSVAVRYTLERPA